MNDASPSSSLEGRTPSARATSIARYLIYAGAAGALLLWANGIRLVIERSWQRGTAGELVNILPIWVLLGLWMLSPYWRALRLQRRGSTTRFGLVVVVCAVLVIIALAANAFLATSAFVGGKPHPTADGVTLLLIPIMQWIVLGAAGLVLSLRRGG